MDLSHWDLVETLTLWEAAYLAGGMDPKLSQVLPPEQKAKAGVIYQELEKAYDSALSAVRFALNGKRFDVGETIDSIFTPSFSALPSDQLIQEIRFCLQHGREFHWQEFYDVVDDDPTETPVFSRDRLSAWFASKGFKPVYSFVTQPAESASQTQLVAQLPTRNHVSDKLAKMNQAAAKFWGNADRADRGTHPDNATVAGWLRGQGFSSTLADKAATIVRPEWAPTGRKPDE